jgi:hypothetical protein
MTPAAAAGLCFYFFFDRISKCNEAVTRLYFPIYPSIVVVEIILFSVIVRDGIKYLRSPLLWEKSHFLLLLLFLFSLEEYTTGTESQQAEKKTNKTTTTWRNYRSDYPPKFSSKKCTCRESFQPTTAVVAATGILLLLFPRLFINFERNLLLFVLCTVCLSVCLSVRMRRSSSRNSFWNVAHILLLLKQ